MTGKRIEGIDGVLGNLISPSSDETARRPSVGRREEKRPAPANAGPRPDRDTPQRARLGRPPGKPTVARSRKEKATLRISSSLIAEYRDQSWEARCSFSNLVEKAMTEYRRRFRK